MLVKEPKKYPLILKRMHHTINSAGITLCESIFGIRVLFIENAPKNTESNRVKHLNSQFLAQNQLI